MGGGVGRRGEIWSQSHWEKGAWRGVLRSLLGSGGLKEKVWRATEEVRSWENADASLPLLVSSWGLWWRGREATLPGKASEASLRISMQGQEGGREGRGKVQNLYIAVWRKKIG